MTQFIWGLRVNPKEGFKTLKDRGILREEENIQEGQHRYQGLEISVMEDCSLSQEEG